MTEIPDGILDRANAIWEASLADGTPDAVTIIAKAILAAEKRGEESERAYMKTVLREVIQQQKWGKGMPYESMLEHLEERATIRKGQQ